MFGGQAQADGPEAGMLAGVDGSDGGWREIRDDVIEPEVDVDESVDGFGVQDGRGVAQVDVADDDGVGIGRMVRIESFGLLECVFGGRGGFHEIIIHSLDLHSTATSLAGICPLLVRNPLRAKSNSIGERLTLRVTPFVLHLLCHEDIIPTLV